MSIEAVNLTHIYSNGTPFESRAVDGVSIKIGDGEFVGLIGHTGSGKSTLIQHFNALLKPDEGKVLVDGVDINEHSAKRDARRNVGLVFQYPEYQLFEETVEKDVAFGPKNLGLSEAEVNERVREALTRVGLPESEWQKSPFELSGGQKRRVAIAGVLAMRTKTLILDEPAAGLDPVGRRDMRNLITDIRKGGSTVILVSHSMDDVARLCSRIIVMNHGRVALDGAPEYVFAKASELTEMGLGLPVAAQLRDRLNAKGFSIPQETYTIDALAESLILKLREVNA